MVYLLNWKNGRNSFIAHEPSTAMICHKKRFSLDKLVSQTRIHNLIFMNEASDVSESQQQRSN